MPDQLVESVPKAVSDHLKQGLPNHMTSELTPSVVKSTITPITESIADAIPLSMVTKASEAIVKTLTQSLAQSIVPTVKQSLSSITNHVRCYYCKYDQDVHDPQKRSYGMCADCPKIAEEIDPATQQQTQDAITYGKCLCSLLLASHMEA